MTIDGTINLGHILTIIGMGIGGVGVYVGMRMDLRAIADKLASQDRRVDAIERDLSKMTQVLVDVARQDARLDAHEQRLAHLEKNG